ncbi:MAG: cation:proton antiporter, partial [Thermoplasmata archaeon]|nr:cation:proton antiporter [Thermoplasmata archaeon]
LPIIVGIIFLIVIILVGRRVFPKIIESVSRAHSKELFLLTIFGICIGVSVASEMFGLSLALGAFMAGIILADSDHHLDIESQIKPLKDIFLIIFFVSVGMTINLRYFFTNPIPIIAVIITIMVGKSVANSVTTRLMGYHPKTATQVGMSMMQIGEFSFIIAGLGITSGILVLADGTYSEVYSVIVAAALITMVFTPYAVRSAPGFYNRLVKIGLIKVRPDEEEVGQLDHEHAEHRRRGPEDAPHVVILGNSQVANESMKCMDLVGQHYTVVDYDPKKIGLLRKQEKDCVYGDAANEDVLKWAGIDYADLIIVAISDTLDAENAISICHKHNPNAYIIARAYGNFDKERMLKFSNDVIISEEVAGKRMAWHVLRNLGLDEESIKQDIEIVEHEPQTLEDEDVSS